MVASWGRFEEGQTFVDKTFVGCAKLYERNEQQRELIEAFQRRRSSSLTTNELVLITGPSGTGKTTLAKAFRSHVEHQENGIWMQGKFDQIHREEPYAAFLSAIEELVKEVEARGAEDILKIQEAIANSVDPFDQQWLARAVPLLTRILWASSENLLTATSSGGAVLNSGAVARNQFRRLIPNLLATICSSLNASIVIFLDDLQWSDLASLELLRDLACDCETPSLMVFGACRGDDVSIDHPLSATLRQLEDKDNVKITNVSVSNLHVAAVQEFVSDALELPALVVQPLADIVFRESEGNVFYMIRFMQNLQECGFLYRDVINHQWTWNEEQIQPRFNDVLQLLSSAIRNLPDNVQQLLQVAACLGSKFKESHLQKIVSYEVEPALATAEEKNMVSVDNDSGECNWVHDRWQQAAYQLIPKAEQPQFHLQIGRMLWNGLTSEKEIDDNIFLTVNQIVKGAHLITDDEERESAATLCLRAGEKAGRSSAFQAAATFFEHGIGLLNRRHWRDQYELSLSLFNGAAEMEYCNGRFDRVNILAEEVIKNARNVMDRLPAYTTMVYAVGTHGKLTAAITLGLSVLKQLDLSFPRNAKMWHVALEFRKTQQALRGKSDDEILSLPSMTNASTFAALKLMNLLYLFAKVERWNLCAVMALRMVRMTLENGLAGASSAPGFAFYGIILCWLGDVDEGYRFAKLSVAILNKFYVKEWIPRVLGTVFGIVYPWKLPLRECMSGMRDGYRVGFETGDHEV
jgi:predicted ATPase